MLFAQKKISARKSSDVLHHKKIVNKDTTQEAKHLFIVKFTAMILSLNAIKSVTAKESKDKNILLLTKLMVNIAQPEQARLQRNLLYGTTQNNTRLKDHEKTI